jgi:hypothetical protein
LVEQDQPALLLLQIKLVPLFFLVKSQNGQIVIRSYLDVLQILLIRQKHLRSDMVQKRSFSFEQFDDLRNVFEGKESFCIFFDLRPSLIKGLRVIR